VKPLRYAAAAMMAIGPLDVADLEGLPMNWLLN
jgi:hypothetical protein